MIVHLGNRVSALLDGQLSPAESERAWAHVHVCPPCRDLVEREGALKQRLAQLGHGPSCGPVPERLKGLLVQELSQQSAYAGEGAAGGSAAAAPWAAWSMLGVGAASAVLIGAATFGAPTAWLRITNQPAGTTSPANSPSPSSTMTPVASLVEVSGGNSGTTGPGGATGQPRLITEQRVVRGRHLIPLP